ncbi:MAG: bifunctional aldolase/short-chain dehydrogenase [Betaproteobacteria bacterium]|jgi:rhamnose utilization protein RhaD (predicted bifunctional aldolase and dehydrogenase)/NAD(P)-dependent dehydrogenase (short-subunit alcohol dehydrogenase family)|nr:bifunctional aldolase/short-chain dehydrogenase [Betaproteobacteria bacterium]
MKSLWQEAEAARMEGDLALRVYTSRLLGHDKSLVLHGGGNTSVKLVERNRFGDEEPILYVKGSGWDLETIEAPGFSPVHLDHVKRLAGLERLSDPDMVNELVTHMLRATAPTPSIETILHGCIPFKYVDHTHADAVLAVTNTPGGEARIRAVYGDSVIVIPYLMPGFDLARAVAREFKRQATPRTVGVVLLKHGIFSFGETAREAYERMIGLVDRAERHLKEHRAWDVITPPSPAGAEIAPQEIADLRRRISETAGFPAIVRVRTSAQTLAFARHPEVERLSQQGPATPDHVIRTKRTPMLGTDVSAFEQRYREYFDRHAPNAREPKTMLDPAPRMVLDPRFGLASVGRSARDAQIVEELYEHTIDVILRADALERYEALPAQEIFDIEYWDLEQAKLRKGGRPPALTGEVAWVTGAASGIGKAAVSSLLARGAAVVGLDVNESIATLHARPDFLGIHCDVRDVRSVQSALERTANAFGGLDMLVLNAGIFGATRSISELPSEEWREVMAINVDANLLLMRACHPYLKLAPRGGRMVVVGSKNVPAPGPGAAAYSASKAALNQLARIAALEWGADGIRVNSLHPNQVFDTALWTDDLLTERARRYGMTVEQYKTNNVLRTEVTSRDVAELAAEMCGPLFAKTTGAQVPVDGGNERVI